MWSCPKNEVYPKYPQIHPNPLVNHHCHIHTTLDVLGVQFWFAPIFYHRGLELSVSPATGAGGTSGNLPQVSPWKKQKRAINARIIGSLSPESEFDQQKCGLTQYTMIGPYTNIDVDTNGHTPKHQFKWPSKSYRFEMFRSLPHLDVGILRQHIMFQKKNRRHRQHPQWCHMLNVGYSRKYVVANLRVTNIVNQRVRISVPLFLLFLMVKSTSKGEHESKSM